MVARSSEVFAKIYRDFGPCIAMTDLSLVMSEYLKSPEEQSSASLTRLVLEALGIM